MRLLGALWGGGFRVVLRHASFQKKLYDTDELDVISRRGKHRVEYRYEGSALNHAEYIAFLIVVERVCIL